MTEHDVLMWIIPGFAGLLSILGAGILQQLRKLTDTAEKLNTKMAVIVERVNHHEGRIKKLEAKK